MRSALAILFLCTSATVATSGGGQVTSTEPGPPPLSEEATAEMLDAMGVVHAKATTTETAQATTANEEAAEVAKETTSETDDEKPVDAAQSGPIEPREAIRACTTCHGVDGIAKIPTAPNIAGSSRQYLETQLKAFRSGKRENEVMAVIAEDLSNTEIKAVAKWYAALKVTVEVPE